MTHRWLSAAWAGWLLAAGLAVPAWAAPDRSLERLRIGGPLSLAPFAYLDQAGVYTGFSVDLMHALGQRLGIENVLFYPGRAS